MYTCICIHMCIYIYIHIYICLCIHIYVYIYVCMCIYICVCIYVYTYIYTCTCPCDGGVDGCTGTSRSICEACCSRHITMDVALGGISKFYKKIYYHIFSITYFDYKITINIYVLLIISKKRDFNYIIYN